MASYKTVKARLRPHIGQSMPHIRQSRPVYGLRKDSQGQIMAPYKTVKARLWPHTRQSRPHVRQPRPDSGADKTVKDTASDATPRYVPVRLAWRGLSLYLILVDVTA